MTSLRGWTGPQTPLWIAALLVAVLCGSVWLVYSAVGTTGESLTRGIAETIAFAGEQYARERSSEAGAEPSVRSLEAFVKRYEEVGLRYVGVYGPGGRIAVEVGTAHGSSSKNGSLESVRERVRFVREARRSGPPGPRPPPDHGPHDPPGLGPDGAPGHGRPPPPPMKIAYEFEPLQRRALDRQANLLLLVALVASMVVMALAWAFARAMRNREELLLQLEKERHLASVGEMSAVLAHEIRNPLASLKGHAQLLQESSEPGSTAEKKSERVVSAALRLEKLTAGLLEFVRSGSIQRSSVDPGALLRAAANDLDGLAIEVGAPDDLGVWPLDEERMRQALVNLLQNAGQSGGDRDMPIEANVSTDSGNLVYEIRDHGVGLPEVSRDIFAPFVTTRTKGTGLGLAVTRSIVKAHGGELVGANHPGGGAVFRIVIPPSRRTRS